MVVLGVMGGFFGAAGVHSLMAPTASGFNPTGGGTYYLQASISSTQNTITLTSFTEPGSGIPYTMSYLHTDIVYGTIAPQTDSNEFISFTGINQNANGTATLTGVSRGLERSYPYVASTTLANPFPGQTRFILSSPPQFFNEYALRRSDQWITGIWGFGALPTSSVVCTDQYQFCNKAYIDAGLNAGAATSTFQNIGIVWLASKAQQAASTASSTTGAPLVLTSGFATSTPNASLSAGFVPVTGASGFLSSLFIATSSQYTWAGLNTFTATTSQACSNLLNIACIFNGLAYQFPSVRGASSTVLTEDGTGKLTWITLPSGVLLQDGNTYATSATAATTSVKTITITPGQFGANDSINITGVFLRASGTTAAGNGAISIGSGSASTTITRAPYTCDDTVPCQFTAQIYALNSSSAQRTYSNTLNINATPVVQAASTTRTAFSTAGNFYISFDARAVNSGDTYGFQGVSVTIIRH